MTDRDIPPSPIEAQAPRSQNTRPALKALALVVFGLVLVRPRFPFWLQILVPWIGLRFPYSHFVGVALCAAGLALYLRATQRSLAWSAMGLLPILPSLLDMIGAHALLPGAIAVRPLLELFPILLLVGLSLEDRYAWLARVRGRVPSVAISRVAIPRMGTWLPRFGAIGLSIGVIIIGLCCQLVFFKMSSPTNEAPVAEFLRYLFLAGLACAILGIGSYAKQTGSSVAWGVLGVLPVLGPIVATSSIILSKLSVPTWARTAIIALILLSTLAAITIPNFLRYPARSRQAEAKKVLKAIYRAEMAFYKKHQRFGDFDEIRLTLPVTNHRYNYRIDRSEDDGSLIPAEIGGFTPDNTEVRAGLSDNPPGFTATATADIDNDPTVDQWHVNDSGCCTRRPDSDDAVN